MITFLTVFLPLFSAMAVGFLSGTVSVKKAQCITCGGMLLAAVGAGKLFHDVVVLGQVITVPLLTWINSGTFATAWLLQVDVLTAVMLVVVTWVSAAVHIYSVGYMHEDPHIQRFMAYLSLFTFCMLMLVTSNNFVQLYFGWEGVGLCSYLLIGFWYKKPSANQAAIKAFVVNRVGDFGFALGIFAIYMTFGSVQFSDVFAAAPAYADKMMMVFGYEVPAVTVICLLLFVGCMGKSAQLGLHTWLPDAMEGPTPVSALIHAATMVTAGVFLVARCSPLFEFSPVALAVVTCVGAATAIFAASVAITQNDIKRIIAYSTCSQLGYMFFACGVSAYSAAIFHLATHAFFKALLFLGAGSVIHAMSNEQDIRKMGGIWKKIPVTYVLMWIGSLALAGIYPFAGYYSKDIILEAAYAAGGVGRWAFYAGILAAFLTAFYSWRLIILVFHGHTRQSEEVLHHVHESPRIMLYPLYFLALGAIVAGIIGYQVWHVTDAQGTFWRQALFVMEGNNVLEAAHHLPLLVKLLPLIVGVAGIALAYFFYMYRPEWPGRIAHSFHPLYTFLYNKWYVDELYTVIFVRPALRIGAVFWRIIDMVIIDGLGPNGMAQMVRRLSFGVSRLQSGLVYMYAFVMLIGFVGFITWYVWIFIK